MTPAKGATRPLGFHPGPNNPVKKKKKTPLRAVTTEEVAEKAIQEMRGEEPPRETRRKRKHPPAGETSRDKFVRLATARVNSAMNSIRLLGNLANRHVYKYEDGDVDVIRKTLIDCINEALSQFTKRERPEIKFVLRTAKEP